LDSNRILSMEANNLRKKNPGHETVEVADVTLLVSL